MDNIVYIKHKDDVTYTISTIWFYLPKTGNQNHPWKILRFIPGGRLADFSTSTPPEDSATRKRIKMSAAIKRLLIEIILDGNISEWFR